MKKGLNLQLIIFFTVLTSVLTAAVIVTWEQVLRPPFYGWVERNYPGPENAEQRWKIQQRSEHFFISMTVDVVVVSILLALVGRQQRRIVESEQRYRALFEHANDGIGLIHSSDFKLVEANSKFGEILGCEPRGLEGRDVRELIHPCVCCESNRQSPTTIAQLLAGNEAGVTELMLGTAAGEARLVAVSYSTISSNHERLIVLLIRDLSARKRLEAERQEMQQRLAHNEKIAALGRVAAQVAHEVRNPLAGLLLYSLHLKDQVANKLSDGEVQLIDKIIDTINKLTNTTEQILNFARPMKLVPRCIDVNGVINDVLQLLKAQISANEIELDLNLARSNPIGMLDEASIRAALLNLMLNAIQAMTNGGQLHISSSNSGEMVGVAIGDTGSGMTEEQIERVFEPFNTTKSHGLGLGMPYAQKIIQQHGGIIKVDSRIGEGTNIRIELPAAEEQK